MFILASRSPQRREILERLGIPFRVIPGSYDESRCTEADPLKRSIVLAERKAAEISTQYPGDWVIGVDTLVVSPDGELLEKPVDEADARRMLCLHSGRTSTIHSGLCLRRRNLSHSAVSTSTATFRVLSPAEIDWWIGTGLWRERSGGFQIDGEGQRIIASFAGEFDSIVGFPVELFSAMCSEQGIAL